jgi:electron transfer flavoprotein alpha/beta subunit
LNELRYLSLPNIVQAKRKPLDTLQAVELVSDIAPRLKTLKVPPSSPEAPIFENADYGLAADLFTILPELQKELDAIQAIDFTKTQSKSQVY